jgi:hypothetical protein
VFEDFKFETKEFDNVPPVIPKFLLFLSSHLKPLYEQVRAFKNLQTTQNLRAETLLWINLEK